ncbi:MAG TPA: hypothetical protein VKY42_02750 [Trueperaceae bacterium]|nr:hypothetical protein [Trueperaceae bacterium]
MRRRRGQAPEPAPEPPPPLPTPPDAGRARTALGPNAFGPLLIGLGALFLVDRFAWAVGIRSVLWALLFAAGAAAFLVLYARDRRHWWALYPGFGLVALAAAVVAGNVGGGLLLGLAGAACIVLFLRESGGRWLLLVGGALVSLALMSLLEGAFPRLDNGWVLFAGLAATLFMLHRRTPSGPGWGLYLSIALAALALISLFTGRLVETLIAVALIASGTAMVWRGSAAATAGERALPPSSRPYPAPAQPPAAAPPEPAPGAPEPASGAAEPEGGEVSRPLWARLRRGRR